MSPATPPSTPTWPCPVSPYRPARPAICAASQVRSGRISVPSNFCVSANSTVVAGTLMPCPMTSVVTSTSSSPRVNRAMTSRRVAGGSAP